MPSSPRLNGFTIELQPEADSVEATNRTLFRSIAEGDQGEMAKDSFLFMEFFRVFIARLDTQDMYSDPSSKKCMTANQQNIDQDDVNTNIFPHSNKFVIEGRVEGGAYGKRRNKTSTTNKAIKSIVAESDAITSDFYFFLYAPPFSKKSILFLQSFSDDSITPVMKNFWQSFYTRGGLFKKPKIGNYIPPSIITEFKRNSTISSLKFTTEIPASTLLGKIKIREKKFKVTIQITPTSDDLTIDEYGRAVEPIQQRLFASKIRLWDFKHKRGDLRDQQTAKTSKFDLMSDFEIHPVIILSKYIEIRGDDSDFTRIREFCFRLLEEVKQDVYSSHAIQDR